ncbi:hypothetical protein SFUMM280S_09812 [Streptomyces fumanus]
MGLTIGWVVAVLVVGAHPQHQRDEAAEEPPTHSVVSHQVMSQPSSTASRSTGPPSTPSQANFAVVSPCGSGGGSGGTKWPSSSASKSSSAGSDGL